mgnify:CR=1 FL=1
MTTIEYLLNKIPCYFVKTQEKPCPYCNKHTVKQQIRYELQIDILPHEEEYRYRIYYKSNDYGSFRGSKHIGENCGIGYGTMKKALKSLLRYKNQIRGRKNND